VKWIVFTAELHGHSQNTNLENIKGNMRLQHLYHCSVN